MLRSRHHFVGLRKLPLCKHAVAALVSRSGRQKSAEKINTAKERGGGGAAAGCAELTLKLFILMRLEQ